MSQSREFDGFREALEPPPRLVPMLCLNCSRSHAHGGRLTLDAAIAGEAQLEEDGLSAGTIVAFRAVGAAPPPLPSDQPAASGKLPDRGVAEAVEVALGRSDGIEQALERTAAELAEARAEAEVARSEAAAASARLIEPEQAGAGLESGLAEARRALDEMRGQAEGLREGLEQSRSTGESQAREDGERFRREAEQGQAERQRLRRELEAVRTAVDGSAVTWPARRRRRSAREQVERAREGRCAGGRPVGRARDGRVGRRGSRHVSRSRLHAGDRCGRVGRGR